MKRIAILLGLIIFLLPNFYCAFAETVYFKNGKTLEGKIVEKTDKYIKIEIADIAVTYFMDGIDKIEGSRQASAGPSSYNAAKITQENKYVDEDYGFQITVPKGWFKHMGKNKQEPVNFTTIPDNKFVLPMLQVNLDLAPPDIKNPLDFAKRVLPSYQEIGTTFKLLESPHEIEINGLKVARFMFDMRDQTGKGLKSIDCKIMKNNLVFSLQGMDYSASFEQNLKSFEEIISSFKFVSSVDEFAEPGKLIQSPIDLKPIDPQLFDALKKQTLQTMSKMNTFKSFFVLKDRREPKLAKNNCIGMEWSMIFVTPQNFEINQADYYGNVSDIWRVVGDEMYIKIGTWIPSPAVADNPKISGMLKARRDIYKMLSFDKYIELFKNAIPESIAVKDNCTVVKFKTKNIKDLFTGEEDRGSFVSEIFIWVDNQDKSIKMARTIIEGKDKDGQEVSREYEHYFVHYNEPFNLGKPDMAFMKESI